MKFVNQRSSQNRGKMKHSEAALLPGKVNRKKESILVWWFFSHRGHRGHRGHRENKILAAKLHKGGCILLFVGNVLK
jgi:hypothetical protein